MISQVNDTEPINDFLKHIIYIQHKLTIFDRRARASCCNIMTASIDFSSL